MIGVDIEMANNLGGRPRIYESAEEMQKKVDEYFDAIEQSRKEYFNIKTGIPTIMMDAPYWTELVLHLGFRTRQSAVPYLKGEYDTDSNPFSDILLRARARVESILAKGSAEHIYDSATVKAVLTNLHDYTEKQEIKADLSDSGDLSEEEIDRKIQTALRRYLQK